MGRSAAPEADPPTIPHSDPPTIPHSLAPLSGSNGDGSEAAAESQSTWSEVWRRRWFVAGAALVAFLSALAFGRLSAPKRVDAPIPTLSVAGQPSQLDAPNIGVELQASSAAAPVPAPQGPPASEVAAVEPPTAATTQVVTSDVVEIPAMEVPPAKGATVSGKAAPAKATRRATAPSDAPHKRFMPGSI